MSKLSPLPLKDQSMLDQRGVWAALADAHRHLAELKGICESLPNQGILLETLGIQEAKDSSAIENIITTHDELFASSEGAATSSAAKEVRHYATALRKGYEAVKKTGLIRLETILTVQAEIEQKRAGLRRLPGTVLRNQSTGQVVYEPPQDAAEVEALMDNLIAFIHAEGDGLDPLLRMAIAHHQFESIHPFYDGNGRTGRILNLLMLQRDGLLDMPVLYLSRYMTHGEDEPLILRLLQWWTAGAGVAIARPCAGANRVAGPLWRRGPCEHQPPFPRPPVRPDGSFRGLPRKANSYQTGLLRRRRIWKSARTFMKWM